MATEHDIISAARHAVNKVIQATVLAIKVPTTAPEFEPAVMAHFLNIVRIEELLALSANALPHREPELRQMFSELGICRDATEQLLLGNGIVPVVLDL